MRLIYLKFLDHVEGTGGSFAPAVCEAVGILLTETKDYYIIGSWLRDQEINEDAKTFTVLKQVVLNKKLVKL